MHASPGRQSEQAVAHSPPLTQKFRLRPPAWSGRTGAALAVFRPGGAGRNRVPYQSLLAQSAFGWPPQNKTSV
jgi:hypothetical protein